MQSITRKLFLTLVAVCVMSVVGTATASAYTNPILVNAKGEHVSKVKFTGVGGSGWWPMELTSGTFECKGQETSTGELSTTGIGTAAKTSGTATLIFKGCAYAGGTCHTGVAGEIELNYSLSAVWLGKESEEKLGVLAAIAPESKKPGNGEGGKVKITCAGVTGELEGGYVARLSRKLGETFTGDSLEANAGNHKKQEYTKFTEEGTEQESSLWWSAGKGSPFEQTATELTEEQTFPETVEITKS